MRGNVLPASVLALLLTPSWVVPVGAADGLELSFDGGRVTVIAANVPVATILMEWSRVGGTDFVAADAIAGPPVTLALRDVPESEALRVLLRAATGYVAAPRLATTSGLSSFDRVLIMAVARRPAGSRPTYAPAPPLGHPADTERDSPRWHDGLRTTRQQPNDRDTRCGA